LEIFEVVVHLLKCKPQCEEAFRRIAWKSSCETFATKRNDLGSISSESRFHKAKGRRTPTLLQRRRTAPQVICYSHFGMRERRYEPTCECLWQRNDGRSSEHHKVMVQPEQGAQQRPRVGRYGETRRPLVLGVGAQHIQLHQSLTDAIVNAVERMLVETLRQTRKQFAKSQRHPIKRVGGGRSNQRLGA
jgi:hypothetical protein